VEKHKDFLKVDGIWLYSKGTSILQQNGC